MDTLLYAVACYARSQLQASEASFCTVFMSCVSLRPSEPRCAEGDDLLLLGGDGVFPGTKEKRPKAPGPNHGLFQRPEKPESKGRICSGMLVDLWQAGRQGIFRGPLQRVNSGASSHTEELLKDDQTEMRSVSTVLAFQERTHWSQADLLT